MTRNRQWLINARPLGRALQDDDFKLVTAETRAPEKGEVLLKTLYLGFDPAQKGWMENIGGYVAPTEIGEVMRGSGVAQVVESKHPKFAPGDVVTGQIGWQEYPTLQGEGLEKVEDERMGRLYLGPLGTTGMTAYFGFLKLGRPIAGDTVVVSGAAGATGSMVGQLAKIAGCRAIAIAGGQEKCAWAKSELGYDEAIDYKAEKVRKRLKELTPGAINVVYDNVGGTILNDMLGEIGMYARVIICGGISRYETGQLPAGPENYFNLVFKRATMQGFIVLDYMGEYADARRRMRAWIDAGQIKYREDVQEGFENAPRTLMRLFKGENFGKQMLKVS
jgi:NADPH-dependent curcumin reductase CurA